MAAAHIFDRDLLTRRRARVAGIARSVDFLVQRSADDLADRLGAVGRRFAIALDLGAGHGVMAERLLSLGEASPECCVVADPLADRLAYPSTVLAVAASEEALPFADASLDLVVSALSLHLVNDLPGALVQIRRALKPDGLLLASLLGGATLRELREAMLAAEVELTGGASPRVAPFADVRDLGMLLQRAGFALPVVDSDVVTVGYDTPLSLMRELKAMGASNMLAERRRVPMTRRLLVRAAEIYAERFSRPDGRVVATFEILSLIAWAPHESQPKPLRPGSAQARLADALGVPEIGAGEKAPRTEDQS